MVMEALAEASIVQSLVEVASKVAVSEVAGQTLGAPVAFQFAQVLQLLSEPPPSQVWVSA
jgi:surfactin synthase thioesterase subunit